MDIFRVLTLVFRMGARIVKMCFISLRKRKSLDTSSLLDAQRPETVEKISCEDENAFIDAFLFCWLVITEK